MKSIFLALFLASSSILFAQTGYMDSLTSFRSKYINEHEVVQGADKEKLNFYPVDVAFRTKAVFKKTQNARWFSLPTSGTLRKTFREYGRIEFVVNDTVQTLRLYQSQQLATSANFADYLFLPFTDRTNGSGSYEVGRYLDIQTSDIKDNQLILDFNKAYNPYCSYVTGKYNCPIPPPENKLSVAIIAGEKSFGKPN